MIVNSERSLAECIGKLTRQFKKDKYLTVKISSKKRSLDANALSHVWYQELARQGDESWMYYKCYCKYHFGMTLMDDEYKAIIRKAFGGLLYEEQISAMKHIDVTSTFNREQMKQYMENVKLHFEREGYILSEQN